MNRCTKGAVRLIFDRLEKRMGTYEFPTVFEYILTDRGSEFGDPVALETGISGIQRSSIYYCDPMQSGQKGGIEQAHTMLRMILPKGTCFEFLTRWDVNLIVNHINSTPRESLGGRTPYEMALETLGEEILKKRSRCSSRLFIYFCNSPFIFISIYRHQELGPSNWNPFRQVIRYTFSYPVLFLSHLRLHLLQHLR